MVFTPEQFPNGARVRLVKMDDVQAPPIGTLGTVRGIDGIGSLMVSWDNGSRLNAVRDVDEVELVVDEKSREKSDEKSDDPKSDTQDTDGKPSQSVPSAPIRIRVARSRVHLCKNSNRSVSLGFLEYEGGEPFTGAIFIGYDEMQEIPGVPEICLVTLDPAREYNIMRDDHTDQPKMTGVQVAACNKLYQRQQRRMETENTLPEWAR